MQVEKRLMFGFKGAWGKVFKLYTFTVSADGGTIKWQGNNYRAVDGKVQFRELNSAEEKAVSQTVTNLITDSDYKTVVTSDAVYDNVTQNYKCIVGLGDIVWVLGRYWAVDKISETAIFTPKKHSVWYVGLKAIMDEILPKEY